MLVPRKILTLVNGTSLNHGINKVAGKFILKIVDIDFGGPGLNGLFVQALQLFLLADVGAEGDDFSGVSLLEPGNQHRGVQATRICQYNLHGRSINFKRAFCQVQKYRSSQEGRKDRFRSHRVKRWPKMQDPYA